MENQPPPLSPQEISAMQTAQYAETGKPQAVTIFGIMHIIFAAFGFLSSIWAAFIAFAGNPFLNFGPKNPAMEAQAKAQAEMQEQMLPGTLISTAVTLVIAALMLTAGIQLLKKRRSGLVWNNRYAWTSIVGKAITIALIFIYTVPAMEEMMSGMGGKTPMPGGFGSMMAMGMVIWIVTTAIYPILALFFLNRRPVKEWFAAQPH